ncbi:phage tail tape measure protein [[Pasteurella] aerogenes]
MANNLAIGMVIGAALSSGFKSTFNSAKKSVDDLGKTITKSQKTHQRLGNELADLKKKQTALYAEMSRASRMGGTGLSLMKVEYDKISRKLSEVKNKQNQYTAAIKQAQKAQSGLTHAVSLQEKNANFHESQKGKFKSNLMLGTAMIATGSGVMRTYMEQEDAATNLKIAMMKADGTFGQFNDISKIADDLGRDLPGTRKDFYNLAQSLKKQGLSDKVLIGGALKTSAELNVLLEMDQQGGGEFLAKFMESHRLNENELPQAADYLQRAMFAGGLSKDQMYESMKYYAQKLNSMKLTGAANTEKVLAIEAMAGQQGLEGSTFGTGLNMMLSRMNKGPEMMRMATKGMKAEAQDMVKAVGVEFEFWDKKGSFKGIDGMLIEMQKFEKIRKKFGDKGVGLVAEELFGIEGGRLADILAQKGSKGLEEMLTKMREQASLQERIKVKTATLSSALESLGGVWESAVGNMGSVFADDIKQWAKGLQESIEKYTPFIQQHKETIKTVAGVIAGFVGFKLTVAGLGLAASSAISPFLSLYTGVKKFKTMIAMFKLRQVSGELTTFGRTMVGLKGGFSSLLRMGNTLFKGLITGLRAVATAFLTNPIGLAITGIALAAYLIYDNWAAVGPWFSSLWQNVTTYFNGFWTWVQGIWSGVASWVSSAWAGVPMFFSNLWTNISTFFSAGITNLGSLIMAFSPLTLFQSAFATVLSWFGVDLPATFSSFGKNIIDGLVNGIKNAWDGAKEMVSSLGEGIKGWFAEKLGIHSPSRVFKGYGMNVVEGLNIGVAQNAATAALAVSDMATQMKQAAPKELPAPVMKAPKAPTVNMPKTTAPVAMKNERAQYVERMQNREKWQSAVEFKPVLNSVETIAKPLLSDKKGLFGSLWDDVKFGANFLGNMLGNLFGGKGAGFRTPDFNPNASGSEPSIFSNYEPLNRNAVTHNETTQNQGGIVVNFNPTINVNGNAPQGVTEQIQQGMQMSLYELEKMMSRILDQRQRRAYR